MSSKGQKYRMVSSYTGNRSIGFILTPTCGHTVGSFSDVPPKSVRCKKCEDGDLPLGTRFKGGKPTTGARRFRRAVVRTEGDFWRLSCDHRMVAVRCGNLSEGETPQHVTCRQCKAAA